MLSCSRGTGEFVSTNLTGLELEARRAMAKMQDIWELNNAHVDRDVARYEFVLWSCLETVKGASSITESRTIVSIVQSASSSISGERWVHKLVLPTVCHTLFARSYLDDKEVSRWFLFKLCQYRFVMLPFTCRRMYCIVRLSIAVLTYNILDIFAVFDVLRRFNWLYSLCRLWMVCILSAVVADVLLFVACHVLMVGACVTQSIVMVFRVPLTAIDKVLGWPLLCGTVPFSVIEVYFSFLSNGVDSKIWCSTEGKLVEKDVTTFCEGVHFSYPAVKTVFIAQLWITHMGVYFDLKCKDACFFVFLHRRGRRWGIAGDWTDGSDA